MFYIKDNLGEVDKLIPVGEMKWLQLDLHDKTGFDVDFW